MHLVMVDSLKKVENYRDAVVASYPKQTHFKITPASIDAKVWKKNVTNQWTNYNAPGPQRVK